MESPKTAVIIHKEAIEAEVASLHSIRVSRACFAIRGTRFTGVANCDEALIGALQAFCIVIRQVVVIITSNALVPRGVITNFAIIRTSLASSASVAL